MISRKQLFIAVLALGLPTTTYAAVYFTLPFRESPVVNAYMDLDLRSDWVYDFKHRTPWQESLTPWQLGYAYDGHDGTDFDLDEGDSVMAAAPGTVAEVLDGYGNTENSPLPCAFPTTGNKVIIEHADDFESRYYHLASGSLLVAATDDVARMASIAESGNSGCSTGPHLHFEVRVDNVATDSYESNFWNAASPSLHLIDYKLGMAISTVQTIGRWSSGHTRAGIMWKPSTDETVCSVDLYLSKVGPPSDEFQLRVYRENSGQTSDNPEDDTTLIVSDTGTAVTVPLVPAASISVGSNASEGHRRTLQFSGCIDVPANRKTWFDMSRTGGQHDWEYFQYFFNFPVTAYDRKDTQRFRQQATTGTWILEADEGSTELLFRAEME